MVTAGGNATSNGDAAMTRRVVTYEEQDAYTGWRNILCYLQRAGKVKAIKTRTHKRERREWKRAVRQADD